MDKSVTLDFGPVSRKRKSSPDTSLENISIIYKTQNIGLTLAIYMAYHTSNGEPALLDNSVKRRQTSSRMVG